MQEKISFFSLSLGFLVIIAVVFIYLNYSKKYGSDAGNNSVLNTAPSSVGKIQFSTSKGSMSVSPEGPAPEDMQQFNDRINALAEDTSKIIVSGCKANPSLARIKKNDTTVFQNGGPEDATVVFNGKQIIIPFRGAEKVTMDFLMPGIHGFGCSLIESTPIGFILITE